MFPRHAAPTARPPHPAITPLPPSPPTSGQRHSPAGPPTGLGWPHSGEPGNSRVSLRRNDRLGFLLANHTIPQRSIFKPRTRRSPSSRRDRTGQGRAVRGRQSPIRATTWPSLPLTGKSMTRHLTQTVVQGLQSNPQFFGCLRLVTVVLFQHPQNHLFFHLP